MNITTINGDNSRIYTVRSAPNNNNIRFIKKRNNVNTRRKRLYARAEVFFHKKIPSSILEYMKMKGIKEEESAYLNYIETIQTPLKTRHGRSPTAFTVLFNENEIDNVINVSNNTRLRYYNEKKGTYTLTKGYGRKLLKEIEASLKREGIRYILLTPSNKKLYTYYEQLKYRMDTTGVVNRANENNEKNDVRVPDHILMYKDLEVDE